MYTVLVSTRVDGSLYSATLYILCGLIGLLAERLYLSLCVSATSETAIFGDSYRCSGTAILCRFQGVTGLRAGTYVELIEAGSIRDLLPERALGQGLGVRVCSLFGGILWRSLVCLSCVVSVCR